MASRKRKREDKQPSRRARKIIEERAPKLHENVKTAMFLRSSQKMGMSSAVLADLYSLKKPDAVMFKKPLKKRPFEDETSVEYMSQKKDCSLFVTGSHSKKRPNNLVTGRLFDGQILHMFEFGVEKFKSLKDFKNEKHMPGGKPCIVFQGSEFETDATLKDVKNFFLDFFRGTEIDMINLAGLDHVIVISVIEGTLLFRHYRILLMKSGTRLPRVELVEIGPSIDLTVGRTKHAAQDVQKAALKQPPKPKPKKNVEEFEAAGEKLGRIHMKKQDLDKIATRKMKGLKRQKLNKTDMEESDSDD